MNIALDVRCLAERYQSGVGEYVRNLLRRLPALTPQHHYRYFFHRSNTPPLDDLARSPNVSTVTSRLPSKLHNAAVRWLAYPRLDDLCSAATVFLPSLQSVALRPSSRLVVTFHDLSFERYGEFFSPTARLWHRLVNPRWLAQRADAIVAISEHTKRELVSAYGVAAERIAIAYPGVDEQFFTAIPAAERQRLRQRYRLPERFLLGLGNLEPRKNFIGLLDAFRRLPPSVELVIVGRPVYGTAALRTQPHARVHWLGYIPREDRPGLYQMAAAFVYPSYYEGFGLPVLEAMASGTPVITSASSSLPEVVGDAGLLVDPYDVGELARAMQEVLTDATLSGRLRELGQRQARRFTWEQTASATAAVLAKLSETAVATNASD